MFSVCGIMAMSSSTNFLNLYGQNGKAFVITKGCRYALSLMPLVLLGEFAG